MLVNAESIIIPSAVPLLAVDYYGAPQKKKEQQSLFLHSFGRICKCADKRRIVFVQCL